MLDLDRQPVRLARTGLTDRAVLEALVDAFIRDELPSPDAGAIAYAAEAFERRADALPRAKQVLVRRFAAALRDRLALRDH